jgi:hypothetical protein
MLLPSITGDENDLWIALLGGKLEKIAAAAL